MLSNANLSTKQYQANDIKEREGSVNSIFIRTKVIFAPMVVLLLTEGSQNLRESMVQVKRARKI